MNKNILILFAALTIVFTACDKVEAPYKTITDNTDMSDTVRTVLLEDYSGHTCVNCPSAHEIIEGLQHIYGKRLISMVIHTGQYAAIEAAPYQYDFTTPVGETLRPAFSVGAFYPVGVVNRRKINGSYLVGKNAYATQVSLALMPIKPDVFIEITKSYNSTDSTIDAQIKITSFTDTLYSGKYNVALYVTESNIIQAQKDNRATPEDVLNYNHKNVLRGAINGTWGEQFIDGQILNNDVFTKSYTGYKIGKDWNPANLHLVAVVTHADGPADKVVIQARQVNLL